MGKNKSKSGGRRPGKGPHPKAGQGKHNSSAAKVRSRSIGSAASIASREDLKSIDDNRSRDGGLGGSGDIVNLDDFVATSPPPKSSSNENYVNSNNSNSSSFHRATSPLPSTVTIETTIFSPIQEEPASSMVGTPSPAAASMANGRNINNHSTSKTPFNSPAAVSIGSGNGNSGVATPTLASPAVVVATKEESAPEVTASPLKQAPESSPEPTSPVVVAAVNSAHAATASTTAKIVVLVSSSALKREVVAHQQRAETMLKANNIPYELLDGSDPNNKTKRDQLFQLSSTKQYPQFFRVVGDNTAWQFVGDWDFVESSNECGTLVQDLLGTGAAGAVTNNHNKTEESAAPMIADVDVWSSNLKNHVTIDHDGPAVLDVSTDYGAGTSGFLGVVEDKAPPAKSADKQVFAPPTKTTIKTVAKAAPPPVKTANAAASATTIKSREGAKDFVVDLSAPHPSEQKGARSDDCQCVIL